MSLASAAAAAANAQLPSQLYWFFTVVTRCVSRQSRESGRSYRRWCTFWAVTVYDVWFLVSRFAMLVVREYMWMADQSWNLYYKYRVRFHLCYMLVFFVCSHKNTFHVIIFLPHFCNFYSTFLCILRIITSILPPSLPTTIKVHKSTPNCSSLSLFYYIYSQTTFYSHNMYSLFE